MNLPSRSIHLLTRVYACYSIPWRIILAEGDRAEGAARHLVALGLAIVVRSPERQIVLTNEGRAEMSRLRQFI